MKNSPSFFSFSLPYIIIPFRLRTFWSLGNKRAAGGGGWKMAHNLKVHPSSTQRLNHLLARSYLFISFALFIEVVVSIKE